MLCSLIMQSCYTTQTVIDCQAREPLPKAKVISMFMNDKNVDVNENYVVNFFIGEFSRFLESRNIEAVYSKKMDGVYKGWYAMLEFNGNTELDWNGVYHYKYTDVSIFFFNPNNEGESYWVELGDFKTGTRPGDLLKVFEKKF